VIDACAGAGGKTLALGAIMGSRGRLVGMDVSDRKLDELRRRARRAGLSNARAVLVEPDRWPDEIEELRGRADRVLVDAPCSGVGALRRNPEARWRLAEEDLARLAREQEAIARRAAALVAPGGRLIYATCTVLAEENDRVVERFLQVEKGWTVMRPAEIWGAERAFALSEGGGPYLRMLPHRHATDGFFAAVLRRPT
jgi:16S rRNA (cytosine967-C5)-methyltransferase